MNYQQLIREVPDEAAAFDFCLRHDLLKETIFCPNHENETLHWTIRPNRQFKWSYRCHRCKNWYSMKKDTFFDHCNLPLDKALYIMYLWMKGDDQQQICYETTISRQTCSNWLSTLRDVCVLQIESELEIAKIGGPNHTVEIDESHLFKRKYERGRIHSTAQWVIGGIDRETKETFIVPVRSRSTETLIPIIMSHVEPGTHIITDGWAAYRSLPSHGFTHSTVNHSRYFVDPQTGAHTNLIENLWKWLKGGMPKTGTTQFKLQGHLYEFLWKRKYNKNRDGFDHLINHMALLFQGR